MVSFWLIVFLLVIVASILALWSMREYAPGEEMRTPRRLGLREGKGEVRRRLPSRIEGEVKPKEEPGEIILPKGQKVL